MAFSMSLQRLRVMRGSQPPSQVLRTRQIAGPRSPADTEFGGSYQIYGTVASKGTPANTPLKRRVRLHRSKDGLLVRETWSKADGSYAFKGISGRYEYDVIAWDHELKEYSAVANNQLAEAMP